MMAVEKKNIFLSNTIEPLPYVSKSGRGPEKRIPDRDVNTHANFLKRKFEEAYAQSLTQKQVAAIRYKEGTYLEFSGKQQYDLSIKSLENLSAGIRLLNVKTDKETDTVRATVYVPEGKEAFFINKVEKYLESYEKNGKPKYNDLISSIDDVKLAFLEAFWIGKKEDMPTDTPVWCEIWLRVEDVQFDEVESSFSAKCEELGIHCDEKLIKFPERLIKLIYASATQLGELISRHAYIAEIRRAPEVTSFFEELNSKEQREWVEDLLSRIDYDFSNAAICILDTGVSSGHLLLSGAFDDDTVQSVEAAWGNGDHDGHGTEMAGIALYYNLQDRLLSPNRQRIVHHLESVKILPPKGENDPKLYGAITQRAVYLAEISRPHIERTVCMAVTSERYNTNDGSPTSWSGAVDSIVSGAMDRDEKRLFFVSAGNVYPFELSHSEYPESSIIHSVESPGQAWNAITVGAYSQDVRIEDNLLKNYRAVANSGELSPYSSTSVMWDDRWPIKPEILCDGGNVATNGTDYTECTDLSLLTTHYKPLSRLFSTIWGTSSATAQAAWMAAQIIAEYPGIWPETVRALLIHSARWTDSMKSQFCKDDKKQKVGVIYCVHADTGFQIWTELSSA
jgi:Subtilase family.